MRDSTMLPQIHGTVGVDETAADENLPIYVMLGALEVPKTYQIYITDQM
jgi:hypothetical protein